MVIHDEIPDSKRKRVFTIIFWWAIGIPLTALFWLLLGWWSLILIVPAVWATWDYARHGDHAEYTGWGTGPG